MSERLDPEVKALRAVVRALAPLDTVEHQRIVTFLRARYGGVNGHTANEARMRECLRWLYGEPTTSTRSRELILQALRETQ